MAVSKRLRYEVLKRDNHTCAYCGRTAPEVKLTIDHVVPTTLGGDDDPSNLVAACADCNSGKSSSNPDAPIVANVAEDALRWAKAQQAAAQQMLTDLTQRRENCSVFKTA
jgi:5-methylcytosine-specific restriction endonuclease McrA